MCAGTMPRRAPRGSLWAFLSMFIAITCGGVQAKATKGQGRVVLQFHEITTCKGVNPPFELKNASISRSKLGANSMNADFFNHKLAKSFSKVEVSATKCADAVSFNTCEYEGTLKFTVALCQMVSAQNMPWSSVFAALQPLPRCPLQPGAYELRNATVDMNSVVKFAGPNFFESTHGKIYVADFRGFDEKDHLHVCFTTRFSFMRMRS